jgi:hypothetical protein
MLPALYWLGYSADTVLCTTTAVYEQAAAWLGHSAGIVFLTVFIIIVLTVPLGPIERHVRSRVPRKFLFAMGFLMTFALSIVVRDRMGEPLLYAGTLGSAAVYFWAFCGFGSIGAPSTPPEQPPAPKP